MLLGSTWSDRKNTHIIAIVKIVSEHPDKERKDEIIVLALNLLTGVTEDLVFDTKKDEFPFTKLKRM